MTKRYCPKCKGETESKYDQEFHHDEGLINYPMEFCLRCVNPAGTKGRMIFTMDCLTEEQLKDIQYQNCDCNSCRAHHPESCTRYPVEDKQAPPLYPGNILIAKSDTWKKSANDTNEMDDVEWIEIKDRRPEVGQEIKAFSDNAPQVIRKGVCSKINDKWGVIKDYSGKWCFDKWKAAQANKDVAQSNTEESSTVECDCEGNVGMRKAFKMIECPTHREYKTTVTDPCSICGITNKGLDMVRYYGKSNHNPEGYFCQKCLNGNSIKSESQIAIDKVIQALYWLLKQDRTLLPPDQYSAWFEFKEKLEGLNK